MANMSNEDELTTYADPTYTNNTPRERKQYRAKLRSQGKVNEVLSLEDQELEEAFVIKELRKQLTEKENIIKSFKSRQTKKHSGQPIQQSKSVMELLNQPGLDPMKSIRRKRPLPPLS